MSDNSGFEKVYAFVSKKHNLTILRALLNSPSGMGFNAIIKACPGITPRILSTRLKELEKQKLVSKSLLFGAPPKIEYRATSKAEGVKSVLAQLEGWWTKELS